MARQAPPSLDRTGTQAAIYPSEEALWAAGPPVNEAGDQGVDYIGSSELSPPPAPTSARAAQDTEDFLQEVLNGQTSNVAYGEIWQNNAVYGPQGFGDWNQQPYQTGPSQIVQSNPGSEQGWGVGPARRWAHYPKTDSPNYARNLGQHNRNGSLPWVVADSSLYERSQLAWEQQWAPFKRRSPVSPVVPVPVSVPFVQTVPTFGGGPSPYPGVDLPVGDSGVFG